MARKISRRSFIKTSVAAGGAAALLPQTLLSSRMKSKVKLGFIGTGLMVLPMAKNLLKSGFKLKAFNRSINNIHHTNNTNKNNNSNSNNNNDKGLKLNKTTKHHHTNNSNNTIIIKCTNIQF